MKRLKKQYALNVPEPWLPIMDAMQNRTPEMKAEKARKKAEAAAEPTPFWTEAEIAEMTKGRQPCQVWDEKAKAMVVINYTPEDRIRLRLTVLAECTVKGPHSQGRCGQPVWHKARE